MADYAEILAWLGGQCSSQALQNYLKRLDENDYNVGAVDRDDDIEILADEMLTEIGHREKASGGKYPFQLSKNNSVVEFVSDLDGGAIYLYLLLATRLNMKTDAVHGGFNGTELFEKLSAQVLKSYLGPARSEAIVFGTAAGGSFTEKVNKICEKVGEGGGFKKKHEGAVSANDDKIDVVGWVHFSDRLPSKLVVFGQSKTGTSWVGNRSDLQPVNFIKKWMKEPFSIDPLRAFFVTASAERAQWERNAIDMGLLFDRCRVVDFSSDLESTLRSELESWTLAAKAYVESLWQSS